jgi:hypothetical protein
MKKVISTAISIIIFAWSSTAQEGFALSPAQLQSVIPIPPNAASLAKYGDMPVGHYTGVPNIDVPIYVIKSGSLSVPVSISYHAGGIKVEEIASWVGLGWSLNAGGSISVQTRGRPDNSFNGFSTRFADMRRFVLGQMTGTERQEYSEDVSKGNIDAEPDIYFYNFPGGSGSMYVDTLGTVITVPATKLQISQGWTIVANDGIRYDFNKAETTESTPSTGEDIQLDGYFGSNVTSYYLSSIISADGNDSILFDYEATNYSFTTIASQTKYLCLQGECGSMPFKNVSSLNTVEGWRLKKIRFRDGEMIFNPQSGTRKDLPGEFALDNIILKNTDSSVYRRYQFYTQYDGSSGASPSYNTSEAEYYRLMLDSLKTFDHDNIQVERFVFGYDNSGLPKRTSFDQDYWGYPNGASNTAYFYPTSTITNPFTNATVVVSGANRNSTSVSQSRMLKKIIYPTGGSTNFDFEHNTVKTTENFNNTTSTQYVVIGYAIGTYSYSEEFDLPEGVATTVSWNMTSSNCGGGVQSEECPLVNIYSESGPLAFNG